VLVDEAINALTRLVGGAGTGLFLAGSVAAVVAAYVIRFLAIAIGFAQAGFAPIATQLHDIAPMLGARPGTLAPPLPLPPPPPAPSICRSPARRCGARRFWCSSTA